MTLGTFCLHLSTRYQAWEPPHRLRGRSQTLWFWWVFYCSHIVTRELYVQCSKTVQLLYLHCQIKVTACNKKKEVILTNWISFFVIFRNSTVGVDSLLHSNYYFCSYICDSILGSSWAQLTVTNPTVNFSPCKLCVRQINSATWKQPTSTFKWT